MSKVSLPSKELKSALKLMSTLSDASVMGNTTIVLSQTEEEKPRVALTLVNDYVQSQYIFREAIIHEKLKPFVFNPELVNKVSPNQKMVNFSWNDNTILFIEDGRFKSNLRAGKIHKFEGYHPQTDVQVRISGALLAKIFEYCIVPGVYHKVDLSQLPVRIYGEKGMLCGAYDDAFSVMRIQTEAPFSDKIDIQIPRFVADALSSIDITEEQTVGIGQNGFQIVFIGKHFSLSCTGLNQEAIEIENAIKEQGAVNVTLNFEPKAMSDATKPLVKLIPAKDASGAYLVAVFDDGKMSLSMRHREIGDATSEDISGIEDMYIEKGLKSTHANLHPAGFHSYTQLLNTPQASMEVFQKAILYKCKEGVETTDGVVQTTRNYLFPSVEV